MFVLHIQEVQISNLWKNEISKVLFEGPRKFEIYILHVSIMCCKTDSCGFDSAYKKKYPPFFGQSF